MKFILLVVLAAGGGTGMNMWKQPAFGMAEFGDEAACQRAAAEVAKLVKASKLDYTDLKTACVPSSSAGAVK